MLYNGVRSQYVTFMARPLRIQFPGALYHIVSRGNEKQMIFFDEDDRRKLLKILAVVMQDYKWRCYCYCLMGNHYHLAIKTEQANLSAGMRQLNGLYSQWFNKRHGRVGHLFQGRFRSQLVDSDRYLLSLVRYIHQNPLRANLCSELHKWKWSSYHAFVGRRKPRIPLEIDELLSMFGATKVAAKKNFVSHTQINEASTQLFSGNGLIVADEDFILELDDDHFLRDKPFPKAQRFQHRPTLDDIFTNLHDLDLIERNNRISMARNQCHYQVKEIADYLGLHRGTVSRILRMLHIET